MCLGKDGGNGPLIYRYGKAVGSEEMMQQVSPAYEIPSYTWYPETEFLYMSNKNGFFVATKGGDTTTKAITGGHAHIH